MKRRTLHVQITADSRVIQSDFALENAEIIHVQTIGHMKARGVDILFER
jgi:hypothetical protein